MRRDLKLLLLEALYEDHVDLWRALSLLRREFPSDREPQGERDLLLESIREMLEAGVAVVGQPSQDGHGFDTWNLSPSAAIERIASEWKELGRDPDLWEIAWFTTSAAGDRLMAD
jgi:hypothetical protein